MKKCLFIILFVFTLSGCGHEHIYTDATCTTPKTCTACGETEGDTLGHNFLEATCETPEICERCGETRGDALGHNFLEATCETPEICERCGEIRGIALGHNFIEATCESPQICERCNFVGQEALGHTIEVGRCDRCRLYQGKDIINSILEKLKYADSITELAFMAQTSSNKVNYDNLLSGITYYESSKIEYESALELCGNYPDLATLKKDIENVISSLPLKINGNTREALLSYSEDLKNFILAQTKCQITAITLKKLIK